MRRLGFNGLNAIRDIARYRRNLGDLGDDEPPSGLSPTSHSFGSPSSSPRNTDGPAGAGSIPRPDAARSPRSRRRLRTVGPGGCLPSAPPPGRQHGVDPLPPVRSPGHRPRIPPQPPPL